jgi:hypothetical protein
MRLSKGMRLVEIEANKLGFDISRTRNNHLKLTKPGCQPVFCPGTPGDIRSQKNAVGQIRRSARGVTV